MIDQTISHYMILEKLGEGGMGVVYKAHDTKLDRFVALKFLPAAVTASPADVARFEQEAKAISALNHPNIATIYDIDECQGQKFLVLEFIPGGTLKSKVKKLQSEGGELPVGEVIDYGVQIAEALAHAHRHQIIHRDVKTDNVMLTAEGKVKLTDFGLAKLRGATQLTRVGSTLGTAAYMSPEQVRGEDLDSRSDLFSFGIVLYELVTGRLPFRGEHEAALAYSIVNENPLSSKSIRHDVPPSLEDVILRCLEKDREKRYQRAEEIISDLEKIRQEITGSVRVQKKSSTFLLSVVASILIVVVVGLYFIFQSRRGSELARPLNVSLSQVTFAEGVEEYPSWSQDGNLLAFSGEVNGYKKFLSRNLPPVKKLN
ncbi:MAG: protein kinase [Ignavibacteria bacterium]|nr:protein kinase [Ignavibacteria bacterium]MBI3766500.1 protein kinase [Ignavibacteriales bacterium]